jgi:hypothetical protein
MQRRFKRPQVRAKSPFMLMRRGMAAKRYTIARIPPTPNAMPSKKSEKYFLEVKSSPM